MKSNFAALVVCLFASVAGARAFAADSKPVMVTPGKLIFEDDFASGQMKPKWNVGKGNWSVKDGVVTAFEIPEDHHGAYAYINPNVEYKDVLVEFSFKLDTAKNLHLNMRDSKYKGSHAGHILQAIIMPDKVQLQDMKLGGMKNEYYDVTSKPTATPAEKKEIQEKVKDKTATFKASFDPAAWHEGRVEVLGDQIVISIDGKPVGYLKSEGIDHAAKNMIGFTVGGKSAEIKNVKAWDATAALDWTSRKDEVIGSLKK
ncbi:MAG TPA: family 16 glycoside hydrolase [Tepidisphaeraceae bacterium]|jgi:hypothetical protein|nr:family 16 glycoside hydrolase [Tepidisphaeraceae bacterium]